MVRRTLVDLGSVTPSQARPAARAVAGRPAAGADRPGPAERGNPHRVRAVLDTRAGSRLAARRAQQTCIPRDKIFSEKISTRVRGRPRFAEALRTAREVKAHAPHCRLIVTVYEMTRFGHAAAELTAPADRLTAHGLVREQGRPGRIRAPPPPNPRLRPQLRPTSAESLDAGPSEGLTHVLN